ncbi:MAG: BNR repeat-containing protein, partial [Chitinophagaceae bacterium]|nr:BNR repeat-containing protein [Chitinophagaceae bacterium]
MHSALGQPAKTHVKVSKVDSGWAGNSINAVIFRKNAITSIGRVQFIAYYNNKGKVVLGKRTSGKNNWHLRETSFTGNIKDAHNSISLMADGNGYLHMAWNHHNNTLHYARSRHPFSLEMTDVMPMNGEVENKVTYPEFFRMPDGGLLFLYRDGQSGRGNLVMKKYDLQKKTWETLHQNLIDGEGKRNAYWQAFVDKKGTVHLSWVWRESANVSTNHDMCYARSNDGGRTWQKSDGTAYTLPVKASSAEYAARIPQNSDLINQTSMTTDGRGNPYIAT